MWVEFSAFSSFRIPQVSFVCASMLFRLESLAPFHCPDTQLAERHLIVRLQTGFVKNWSGVSWLSKEKHKSPQKILPAQGPANLL